MMIKKLIEKVKQPKKPITVSAILRLLLIQSFWLLIILLVIVVWTERAAATCPFVLMGLGISLGLWIEIHEAGVEQR